MNKLISYFFRGLLFITPIVVTIYIFTVSLAWVDGLINDFLPVHFPGLGFFIIIATITILGFIGSRVIFRPIILTFEKIVKKLPLINLVYSSLKDLVSAFVGEQKKFNIPVLVIIDKANNIKKLGFITQDDMDSIALKDNVAVYLPNSYAFSGELFIVPNENIISIAASGTDVMKFIVSGGVTKIN